MGIRLLYKMMNVSKLYPKLSELVSVEETQNICIALVDLHSVFVYFFSYFEIFLKDVHPPKKKKSTGLCINVEIQTKIIVKPTMLCKLSYKDCCDTVPSNKELASTKRCGQGEQAEISVPLIVPCSRAHLLKRSS